MNFARFGGDAFDFTVFGGEVCDFSSDELAAVFFDGGAKGGNEFLGREVAVLWPPDAAFCIDGGRGFEFFDASRVADFGLETEAVGMFGDVSFFF